MYARLGKIFYWLGWPVWFVYFRINPRRSRVMVVGGGKLLLLKSWLGDGDWGLPGGGAKLRESLESAACRELFEESGIIANPSQLKPLGDYVHNRHGLKFNAYFFWLELPSRPELVLPRSEISDGGWFDAEELKSVNLNTDAAHAVGKFAGRILL